MVTYATSVLICIGVREEVARKGSARLPSVHT
jgi:hypothetical protein